MHRLNEFLSLLDNQIGGSQWFAFLLLGTGLFFTIYLKFPQIRFFRHALKIVRGVYDRKGDEGDTSHFQALATALSGTVGTGNIAGVAYAIFLGGPAALFWMLVTAMFGMTTKFVEVTLSHKYRVKTADGTMAGGPMYYMSRRLTEYRLLHRIKLGKSAKVMAVIFAFCTILSSFGTGSLPQINSIAGSIYTTFKIDYWITGLVLSILLGLVIIGGIRRIAKVTSRLVPAMALIYFLGSLMVIVYNYENIIPSFFSIFEDLFTGTAAAGGFLGANFAYAFNRGVNRGLFSNEAGQGSAPIAHASARAHEPVSEGMVAILEPFIDTIIICSLTGLVILSSGAWSQKYQNTFQVSDMMVFDKEYQESDEQDKNAVFLHITNKRPLPLFSGNLEVKNGRINSPVTLVHARSFTEDVRVYQNNGRYTGTVRVNNGLINDELGSLRFEGKSLIHSAPLTTEAFTSSFLGNYGRYIVSIGILLFAFSTAISWSYYGDRAVTFLFGSKYVLSYHVIYVIGFFIASFTDTTIVWTFSGIAIALMTIPNLVGILLLHREMKDTVEKYWTGFVEEHPGTRTDKHGNKIVR
ncbi:MAG: sodium:alanine symporter family protein [Cyclobacteriaceae bacterium]|nr:sodium:alanine symporter family protein [Cyclobacteriaceae bacterium]